VTMPGARPLRQLAEAYGIEVMDHDPHLGGRFSVLSNVGLLPAAAAGLDIYSLRSAALDVQRETYADPTKAAPAIGAALQYTLLQSGKNMTVLMPYCDRLDNFSKWFAQLWGESVGKEGKGSTPIKALGAVDQHSQLQLYQEGPKDKLITFLAVTNAGKGGKVDSKIAAKSGMDYLGGHTIGNVIDAQQRATAEALSSNGVPVRWMEIAELNEKTLGALLMHFMLETMLMAGLMNVDAFNQPGVEMSKHITREMLDKAKKAA
jgi:glucose-6-phosphate isomerase